jgi:cytoskeleton-associated protein 5
MIVTSAPSQCLWKVSKTIKESLEKRTLSPSRLLRDIDDFLIATPPAEWRRRHTDNIPLTDMPLRTVKTILQQIVSVYGENVFDELHEVEEAENSFVYQYLVRLSGQATAAATAASSTATRTGSNHLVSPMEPVSVIAPKEAAADIEMNQRLKVIFDLIGDPVNSRTVRPLSMPS